MDLDAWMVWVRETSQMADPVLELILGGSLVWQSALIFTKQGEKVAIIGSLDADGIRPKDIFDRIVTYDHKVSKPLLEELDRISPNQLAINYSINDVSADGLSVGMYRILKEHLKDTPHLERLTSAETLIGKLRGRKTETELARIQKAVDITEEIFSAIESELKVGITELSIH